MFNKKNIFLGFFLISIFLLNTNPVFGDVSVSAGANSNSQDVGSTERYATGPGSGASIVSSTGNCVVTADNQGNNGGFTVYCTGAGTCNVDFSFIHGVSGTTETGSLTVTQIGVSEGGGCLIATATYGTELAPQVQQLRELRDNTILKSNSGMAFMTAFNQFYYSFSPGVADFERENPVFKEVMKIAITPFISSLSILNYVNLDSDVEVLGYLSGLAILNIGMYIGIPILGIIGIKKKLA